MSNIVFKNIEKTYPNGFKAIENLNLNINAGEFIVLVGPSGCAKTTTLRMIAGLEDITGGELLFNNKVVNKAMPKERELAMVFQNYALYPHMTVRKNLQFGLKMLGASKAEQNRRAEEVAKLLELDVVIERKPSQLSGGQAQRVALGRALIKNPKIFLFDEPLSNLDAKLRTSMRKNIIELHDKLNQGENSVTSIYVTHNQVEAMTMGDRICVLNKGKVMQFDTPDNVYSNPKNLFVAGFIGSPEINKIEAKVIKEAEKLFVEFAPIKLEVPQNRVQLLSNYVDKEIIIAIRPENIKILEDNISNKNTYLQAKIDFVENMGHEYFIYYTVDNKNIVVCADKKFAQAIKDHSQNSLIVNLNNVHFFDKETEENIFFTNVVTN